MEAEAGGEEDPRGGLSRAPKDSQGEIRRAPEIVLRGLYGRGLYHWYIFSLFWSTNRQSKQLWADHSHSHIFSPHQSEKMTEGQKT